MLLKMTRLDANVNVGLGPIWKSGWSAHSPQWLWANFQNHEKNAHVVQKGGYSQGSQARKAGETENDRECNKKDKGSVRIKTQILATLVTPVRYPECAQVVYDVASFFRWVKLLNPTLSQTRRIAAGCSAGAGPPPARTPPASIYPCKSRRDFTGQTDTHTPRDMLEAWPIKTHGLRDPNLVCFWYIIPRAVIT